MLHIPNALHFNVTRIHHNLAHRYNPCNVNIFVELEMFRLNCPFLHIWNIALGRLAPKCFFMQNQSLWRMLLPDKSTWLFRSTFPVLHTPICLHSYHLVSQHDAQTQSAPHHYPSCDILSCPRKYVTPHLLVTWRHQMSNWRILIPPNNTLDFIVKHMKTSQIPFTTIWKGLWVKTPPFSFEHTYVRESPFI